nr:MAG TPA: hypothetical protein [Caudoviricetes sp.]
MTIYQTKNPTLLWEGKVSVRFFYPWRAFFKPIHHKVNLE